ncbi:phosphatase PAP2 family protein [uncultured Algibacter sp.]|uniref:phosphatase PAP2 family protein n=1 Tax=uncultured Algibacter sp. TaxID=298659 RepID=UPI002639788B|nr:phosphatase PAP2 family protein [uncultured Algibacter sp.]
MKYILILVFIFIGYSRANGQELPANINSDSSNTWQHLKYDFNTTWKSVKYSITRPLDWKGKDYAKLGTIVVGTMALSLTDEGFNDFATRQNDDFPKVVRDFGWYFGSPQNYFMANAGLYGFGLFTNNQKVRRTSVLIISSSITTGLIQSLTKSTIGRARPTQNLGAHEFNLLSSQGGFHSFPSGHTILSVTMAHSIAKQFDNVWTKTGIYTVGAIPPISRLIAGAHWLTDVIFSAALSIIVVDSIDNFLYKKETYGLRKPKSTKVSWNLSLSPNKIGVVGTF